MKKEKESFDDIYIKLFPNVYRYVLSICENKELAEEITQETFFKALENYKNFRGDCKISVWLCQIAKHEYYRYCKGKKGNMDVDLWENIEIADSQHPESIFLKKEQTILVLKKLHVLDEPYKEVFLLRIFSELSFKDISCIFDKTENWARVTFYRAKLIIISKMKEEM